MLSIVICAAAGLVGFFWVLFDERNISITTSHKSRPKKSRPTNSWQIQGISRQSGSICFACPIRRLQLKSLGTRILDWSHQEPYLDFFPSLLQFRRIFDELISLFGRPNQSAFRSRILWRFVLSFNDCTTVDIDFSSFSIHQTWKKWKQRFLSLRSTGLLDAIAIVNRFLICQLFPEPISSWPNFDTVWTLLTGVSSSGMSR